MRQLRLLLVLVCLLVVGVPAAFAQDRTITGKIADVNGQPVVGATVTGKNSKVSTLTNSEGVFSITLPSGIERLIISSVGFATQEVSISGKTNVTVSLAASAAELSEVVVTALNEGLQQKTI